MPDGSNVITPIVPVLVGDDWKAVMLWKALYDAGVYVNVAIYPAVQRGGALLRTSVMATHERDHLDRALEIFGRVKGEVEAAQPPVSHLSRARRRRARPSRSLLQQVVQDPVHQDGAVALAVHALQTEAEHHPEVGHRDRGVLERDPVGLDPVVDVLRGTPGVRARDRPVTQVALGSNHVSLTVEPAVTVVSSIIAPGTVVVPQSVANTIDTSTCLPL